VPSGAAAGSCADAADLDRVVYRPPRGPGPHHGDRDAETLDPRRQVAVQPVRDPFGQRRDDDLVEALMDERPLDGEQRVGRSDHRGDRSPRRLLEQRDRELDHLAGLLVAVHHLGGELRDQQRERCGAPVGSITHSLDERRRGGGPIGDDQHAGRSGLGHLSSSGELVRIVTQTRTAGNGSRSDPARDRAHLLPLVAALAPLAGAGRPFD
jgi:hypothetical protein